MPRSNHGEHSDGACRRLFSRVLAGSPPVGPGLTRQANSVVQVFAAINAIARVVVLEALRGRVAWLMLAVVLTGTGLAQFMAQVAITESREVAQGVLGAWLRLGCVFVTAVFVATSMMRDWNDKGMEMVLAQALPRAAYLAGRLLGYAVVALGCSVACMAIVLFFVPFSTAVVWGVTLGGEALLIAALTLLCMLTLNHMPLGLGAVAGFYLLSRAMDSIVLMSANTLAGAGDAPGLITSVLEAVAFVLPDLDRFARAEWLMVSSASVADLGYAMAQTGIYLVLLAGAALFDLERKVL